MKDEPASVGAPAAGATDAPSLPETVDRATFETELSRLRVREKAHTREGDAIAAARRRLPMVEVDANLTLVGSQGRLYSSSPTTSCGTTATRHPSSAKAARGSPPR
jgi:hypothetical protein